MASTKTRLNRGITLIELLVVLSILAILLSVLLPALAAARIEGQKTKCLTHLRGIAQAASAYSTDDPRGVYGPVHAKAKEYQAEGYSDYGGGPGIVNIPSAGQVFMWNQSFDPSTRPLNQIIYGAEGMAQPDENGIGAGDLNQFQEFQCPGEDFGYQEWPGWQGLRDEVEQPYFRSNGTSFRLNNLIWRESKTVTWVAGVYGRSVAQVPDTSMVLGFMECRAFQTLFTNDVWGSLTVRGELTGYHKKLGFFNVSYVDGHVANVDMGNGTHSRPTATRGFYDVRGKWGRMDCFPDKIIPDP